MVELRTKPRRYTLNLDMEELAEIQLPFPVALFNESPSCRSFEGSDVHFVKCLFQIIASLGHGHSRVTYLGVSTKLVEQKGEKPFTVVQFSQIDQLLSDSNFEAHVAVLNVRPLSHRQ